LNELAARIDNMVALSELEKVDLEAMVDPDLWARYWSRLAEIERLLGAAQREATEIKEQIAAPRSRRTLMGRDKASKTGVEASLRFPRCEHSEAISLGMLGYAQNE